MARIACATASTGATSMTLGDGLVDEFGEEHAVAELPIRSPINKTRLNREKFESCRMDNP
jgi:hypothetical protein